MIESIYILDTASKALILQHTYTGRPPPDALLEYFQSLLLTDPNSYPPSILTVPSNVVNVSTILFHTKSTNNSLILLTPITREPHDATGVIELLNRITEVLEAYFGKEKLGRGIVEGNFDIVEELLGEIVDSGEIMTTESNALRDIVLPPSLLNKFMSAAGLQGSYVPAGTLSSIPWRRTSVKHNTQEFFVDITEYLQVTLSSKQKHISTTLSGVINCTSRLSLTPDVTLALSPPSVVAIPSFHPCVRLSRWTKSPGTVSFIPPDGAFTLLDYETPDINTIDIPVRVETKLEDTGEFEIRLTPGGKKIDDLIVTIPLNSTITGTTNTRPSRGDFTTSSSALTWTISNDKTSAGMLGAGRPGYVLKGQFTGEEDMVLPSDVVVRFACQGWLASGVTVGGLRVSGTGVTDGVGSGRGGVYKGVKGITNVEAIVRL